MINDETQKKFLCKAKENQTIISVYLLSGICLKGKVIGYSDGAIILSPVQDNRPHGHTSPPPTHQMVFAHAISTIVSESPDHSNIKTS